MSKDVLKIVYSLVEKSKNVMVGSVDNEGYPNMKMMFNAREREGIKVFYFTTNTSSLRAAQFLKNPQASIYFHDGRFFKGAMLKGKMEVLCDQETKNLIWRDGDTMYYPEGVTDPDYCVLRFTAETGRLYQNFGSTDFVVG